jgi:hypothetical protein
VKTPCQEEPELWVSELADSRIIAVTACRSCPAIEWCRKEAEAVRPKWGVWHGRDYSKPSVTVREPTSCQHCQATIAQPVTGRTRKFCNRVCADAARYVRQSKVCARCGEVFRKSGRGLSSKQWERRRFCSLSCAQLGVRAVA